MNLKKTLLAVALTGASLSAYAVPTVMQVTGGQFGMGFFTGFGYLPITLFGSGAADITDQYNPAGWNVSAAQPSGVAAPGSIASFTFGTGPNDQVNTFTNAVSGQIDPVTGNPVAGGGPVPVYTGTMTNGTTTLNMSSFFANWNGTVFNQGNSAAALTLSGCAGSSCNYSMSWLAPISGGPFNGQTGSWVLTGTIAAVPEASTYGMMAAGLGLVAFATRRRTRRVS